MITVKEFNLTVLPEGGCLHEELTCIPGTAATCMKDGIADYYYCVFCDRYYKDEQGGWTPVSAAGTYGTKKGVPNTVEFTLVQTTAMKLEVVLPKDNSAGVFEWEVE